MSHWSGLPLSLIRSPEVEALVGVPQHPEHHPEGDVHVHTFLALGVMRELLCLDCQQFRESLLSSSKEYLLMTAILCHDLGKPSTTETIGGKIRSHNHDSAGVPITRNLLTRLGYDSKFVEQVCTLVEHHLAPVLYVRQKTKGKGYRRLFKNLADVGLTPHELELVARADQWGRTTERAIKREFPEGAEFLSKIYAAEARR